MKVEMVPNSGKGLGINIYGPQVTPLVWKLFDYSISSNRIDCPWYRARTKASAFFQGGSNSPKGKWVFIEFWRPEHAGDYMDLINNALSYVTDDGKPKRIQMVTSDVALKRWVNPLANFYEVTIVEESDDKWIIEYNDPLMLTSIVEKSLKNPGVFSPMDSELLHAD